MCVCMFTVLYKIFKVHNRVTTCTRCRPRNGKEKELVNIISREVAPFAAQADMFVNNSKASETGTHKIHTHTHIRIRTLHMHLHMYVDT